VREVTAWTTVAESAALPDITGFASGPIKDLEAGAAGLDRADHARFEGAQSWLSSLSGRSAWTKPAKFGARRANTPSPGRSP
jgi:hypothetical protein